MKRAERHHLKENELQLIAVRVRGMLEERQHQMTLALGVVGVIAVIALGYFFYTSRVQSKAHEMLAQAATVQTARIVAPGTVDTAGTAGTYPTERARLTAAVEKYKAVADAYPTTDAGYYARSQQAAGLLTLGDTAAAVSAYQDVITRAGTSSIYGKMAQLGLAEAQARAGQYDQAITAFRDLAQRKEDTLPIDGILMQLGRAYRDAGKRSDAQQTFNRIVAEFPDSPYMQEAKRELDTLNKAA